MSPAAEGVGILERVGAQLGGGRRVRVELLDEGFDALEHLGRRGDDHTVGPLVEGCFNVHLLLFLRRPIIPPKKNGLGPRPRNRGLKIEVISFRHGLGIGESQAEGPQFRVGHGIGIELCDDVIDDFQRSQLGQR